MFYAIFTNLPWEVQALTRRGSHTWTADFDYCDYIPLGEYSKGMYQSFEIKKLYSSPNSQ